MDIISSNKPVTVNEYAVAIHDIGNLKAGTVVEVTNIRGHAATVIDGPGREHIVPLVWLVWIPVDNQVVVL